MKYSKRTIITAAIVASLAVTGVAAAYSDIQIVPAGPPHAKPLWLDTSKVAPEPAATPTSTEAPASTPTDTSVTSPLPDTTTQTPAEVTPNEPAPQTPAVVENDPTPEPLPAPATPIANVENTNTGVGSDTAGTVSHN